MVDIKNSAKGGGKLSKRESILSSECGGDSDSMMNIVLGPNSARDPDQLPGGRSQKTSIIKRIPND